jgi:hypothetical protein
MSHAASGLSRSELRLVRRLLYDRIGSARGIVAAHGPDALSAADFERTVQAATDMHR